MPAWQGVLLRQRGLLMPAEAMGQEVRQGLESPSVCRAPETDPVASSSAGKQRLLVVSLCFCLFIT